MRIAVVTTAFIPVSHAAVIVRRWIDPLPSDADYEWPGPRTRLASLFVMQETGGEKGIAACAQHGIRICCSVGEALTLGTDSLAVDAVMLIGEHGEFPRNELGQKLYPRKQLLDEVLAVFARAGKSVPLFFDKHFSWDPAAARGMYWTLEDRRIRWFGGSSLPYCPFVPAVEVPRDAVFEEVVMTTWGQMEDYLFHAVEALASLVEKRWGGETGVASVTAWNGQAAWEAADRGEFSAELLDAALLSISVEVADAFRARGREIEIFQLRFRDGLKATIVRLDGLIRKWAVGCRIAGQEKPLAGALLAGGAELFYPHFARFSRRIEDFFLGAPSPAPGTRLYLTTLACAFCMQALARPGRPLPGSEIAIPPVR